jgi:quinol-cytochrome oxidoreductase complex cytochrome b subunit
MKNRLAALGEWIDSRTGLPSAIRNFLYEEIPASSGWHQVFGSVALFLFLVQAFTGALLAFNYARRPVTPTTAFAISSPKLPAAA